MTRPMPAALILAWLIGLALIIGLILQHGLADLTDGLRLVGWQAGLLALVFGCAVLVDSQGWRRLLPELGWRDLPRLALCRWLGIAVNTTMPVAQIGGEVVRARLLARSGSQVDAGAAGASVVVDLTVGLVAQILFALLGIGLLLTEGQSGGLGVAQLAIGLGIFSLLITGFVLAQRHGLISGLARRLQRMGLDLGSDAAALDRQVQAHYAAPLRLLQAGVWRFGGWLMGAAELWLAGHLLGLSLTAADAVILESLGQIARSAGFVIPGGLGVQESGMLAVASWLELATGLVLAAALVRRGRELTFGIGGLLLWSLLESRSLLPQKTQN